MSQITKPGYILKQVWVCPACPEIFSNEEQARLHSQSENVGHVCHLSDVHVHFIVGCVCTEINTETAR